MKTTIAILHYQQMLHMTMTFQWHFKEDLLCPFSFDFGVHNGLNTS